MFRSARLKLTAFYLIIIIIVSGFFSFGIYQGITFELNRRFEKMETRFLSDDADTSRPRFQKNRNLPLFREDLENAKRRVLIVLLYANSIILLLSGAASYLLAGKTLKPLEESLEEQKRFVADASHELRTPITALKTSIEVALRNKRITKNEATNVLKSSLDDVDNLQLLTTNLLNLTQYQKSNGNLDYKTISIKEVIEDAYKKVLPIAKDKEIDLKIKSKDIKLDADIKSLKDMLVIFLDNSIKFTPKGGKVFISTELEHNNIVIKIKDTGIGISKEDLLHIFDRFYKVDQSRSKINTHGFGLGLSLAKRIVDIHKGSIDVSSTLKKGTSFIIKLPQNNS